MKTINETFEDKEFEVMRKLKGKLSWRNFFVLLTTHAIDSINRGNLIIGNKMKGGPTTE